MSFVIQFSPEAERSLQRLPARRARHLRESLLQRLEQAVQLASLRRYGDAASERFHLQVGDFTLRYSMDRGARVLCVHELTRLPSTRLPSVG
jgi:mRNA-degrading endonuclease RelE of RelBE toxin-antitoxin system